MDEVRRRRTFAIISHPDAGKTTLTEKLLLYGGAVRLAGTVRARKAKQYAISDWMELEKQRGISVTSSVMQFEYQQHKINILDTPGHQDFSEDTYRTLMAADSAVMVIDAAKGVEKQTIKLFQVCKKRGIPIFTFINKLDRFGKEPLALIDEIEKVLGIRAFPMNWPVGMGSEFKGVYDRISSRIELFTSRGHGQTIVPIMTGDLSDPAIRGVIGRSLCKKLRDDIELLDLAGDSYASELIKEGLLTPVYFGSALTNFGVGYFLKSFIHLAPAPYGKMSSAGFREPDGDEFTGFVFKIQANMNPAHRDRIAFVRICSGVFRRGMVVNHVPTGRKIRLSQSKQFLAQDSTTVDEAFPGDVIGLFDTDIFRIGDTLTEKSSFTYEAIPRFQPELFARLHLRKAMKRKQFIKGLEQLSEEGALQKYRDPHAEIESPIIGAVGALQFEVLEYRLKHEYGVDIRLEHLPFTIARWVVGKNIFSKPTGDEILVKDDDNNDLILFRNRSYMEWSMNRNKDLTYLEHPPLKGAIHAPERTSSL
jgi:peptide chain release factor 3